MHPRTALLRSGLRLALLVCLSLLPVTPARAGVLYTVDRFDDVASADDCFDATPADCSLRGAIRKANTDGIASNVLLPDGTYRLTIEGADEEFATTGDLDITIDDFSLFTEPGSHPVIWQQTDDRIFHVHPLAEDVVIQGPLTLRSGIAVNSGGEEFGGSIYFFRGDSLTLADVDIIDASAVDAGGCLYWARPISPGFLDLQRVRIQGCETEGSGGGVYVESRDSPVTIDRLEVRDSTAGVGGGGAYFEAGSAPVVIQRSTFEGNRAFATFNGVHRGGGIYLESGSFSVLGTTVTDNEAGRVGGTTSEGGGIYLDGGLLLLRNSTLSGNRVLVPGSDGTEMTASSSTLGLELSSVRALNPAGPLAIGLPSSTMDVLGSIVEGRCGGSGAAIVPEGFSLEKRASGATTPQCGLTHVSDRSTTSPVFRPLAGYGGPTRTHAILPAATTFTLNVPSTDCSPTDQRDAPRPSLFCHSGAVEDGSTAPGPWIFADGFESGDVLAWQAVAP